MRDSSRRAISDAITSPADRGDMSEGAPMMYHGNGGYGGPGQVYVMPGQVERPSRQYPLEVLQIMGGVGSGQGTPRRWQPRRDRQHTPKGGGDSAFGYDSDDSSLSSNASGSNKSEEKGEGAAERGDRPARGGGGGGGGGGGHGPREWRAHSGRRPQRRHHDSNNHLFHAKYLPEDLLNGSQYDTLSQEIWDKFNKCQQSEKIFRAKMALWRYLYGTIRSIFPRYGLYVVGSTMSGFGLDSSDMDLCLYVRASTNLDPRTHALLHLNYILGFIKAFDPGAELIEAKVPILKFRDAHNGVQVDLNCNNVVGIKNTTMLHCFSKMDWRVRPLVTLTKLWAQAHNINDARQRTLSSYSLTLMVIHFLQVGVSPGILPRGAESSAWRCSGGPAIGRHNRASLGELFLQLLRYYADFPFGAMAVSVRRGARVPVAECRAQRAGKNDPHQWKLLCVEEPFDLTNTARSVYDPETFERIMDAFRSSAARLAAGTRLADAWPR